LIFTKKKKLDLVACKELKAREKIEELKKSFLIFFFKILASFFLLICFSFGSFNVVLIMIWN
jgi:hypothetical protein